MVNDQFEVSGTVRSKEVKVEVTSWPDYVFEEEYDLPTLEYLESFIETEKHLPEIPSAKEMEEEGVELGDMNMLLLKKIEELTLYTIQQSKEIQNLKSQNQRLSQQQIANGQKLKKLDNQLINDGK